MRRFGPSVESILVQTGHGCLQVRNLLREAEVVQGEFLVSKTFPLSTAEKQLTINLVALKPIFFKNVLFHCSWVDCAQSAFSPLGPSNHPGQTLTGTGIITKAFCF